MTTLKSREITVYIKPSNIDKGDIGVRFYTEDEQTTSLKFRVRNQNGTYYNFSTSDLKPVISLFAEDGSVWLEKPMELLDSSKGLFEYKLPLDVIKHAGKMKAKLFLINDTSSLHILNFEFTIIKSNVDEIVEKVVDVTSFEDKVSSKIVATLKSDTTLKGTDGIDGTNGKDGVDGKSAYEIAVENGYTGTIEEWLESLKSDNNNTSEDSKITYEKALEYGIMPEITKEDYEWLISYSKAKLENAYRDWIKYAFIAYNDTGDIEDFLFYLIKQNEFYINNSKDITNHLEDLFRSNEKKLIQLEEILQSQPINDSSTKSVLNNKKVLIIGDSITEVNFRAEKNYHKFIADRTGLIVINKGYSGTGWQSRVGGISQEGFEQPDFICLFLGTNDWANVGVDGELGDLENPSFNTVTSAIINTYEQLISMFPYTKIVTMTPLPRIESNPKNDAKGQSGYSLGELSDRIIEIAKRYNSPVLDLYRESGLNVWNDEINKKFFAFQEGSEDGLHPNTLGHEFISHTIQSFWEDKAITGNLIQYSKPKETVSIDNGDGTFTTVATPRNITMDRTSSFYMNFPVEEFDVVNNTIVSMTIENQSITTQPTQLAPELIYWYVMNTYEEGTFYNQYNVVKDFANKLTPVAEGTNGAISYIPRPITIVYRKN